MLIVAQYGHPLEMIMRFGLIQPEAPDTNVILQRIMNGCSTHFEVDVEILQALSPISLT